jgi:hypothetical protein
MIGKVLARDNQDHILKQKIRWIQRKRQRLNPPYVNRNIVDIFLKTKLLQKLCITCSGKARLLLSPFSLFRVSIASQY